MTMGTSVDRSRCRCTCPDALAARRRYRKRRDAGVLVPTYVDATGTHRRIRDLQAAGHPQLAIAEGAGYKRGNKSSLGPTLSRQRIRRDRAELFVGVYEWLAAQPGPAVYTAIRALRAGHPGPWQWRGRDIDNPDEKPLNSSNVEGPSSNAECRSSRYDPNLWFGSDRDSTLRATRVCTECPLRRECLREALIRGDLHGVWGGLSEPQRHQVHRQLRRELADSPELDLVLDRFAGRRQEVIAS